MRELDYVSCAHKGCNLKKVSRTRSANVSPKTSLNLKLLWCLGRNGASLLGCGLCSCSVVLHQEMEVATTKAQLMEVEVNLQKPKMVLARACVTMSEARFLSALVSEKLTKPEVRKHIEAQFKVIELTTKETGTDINSHLHASIQADALAVLLDPSRKA